MGETNPDVRGLVALGEGEQGVVVLRFHEAVDAETLAPLTAILADGAELPTGPVELVGFPWEPGSRSVDEQRAILNGFPSLARARFYRTTESVPGRDALPFPVDGYEAAIEHYDWYDFGGAVKFAENPPGLESCLNAYLGVWAQFVGRFRHLDVTFDRRHRAAHFWGDRFGSIEPEAHVHLFQWLMGELSEVVAVRHMTFAPASMAQKYAGLFGDAPEPFVLSGTPTLPLLRTGGVEAVEQWMATQSDWAPVEVAHMLTESAIVLAEAADQVPTVALSALARALELSPSALRIQSVFAGMHAHAGETDVLLARLPAFASTVLLELAIELGEDGGPAFDQAIELWLGKEGPETMLRSGGDASVQSFGDAAPEAIMKLWRHCVDWEHSRADDVLARMPRKLVPVYQAAQNLLDEGEPDSEHVAAVYRLLLECPQPPVERSARTYAGGLNNACVWATTEGERELAIDLARAAMPYSPISPYLPHSIACALVSAGDLDLAFEMVERAVDSDYRHLAEDWPNAGGSILENDEDLGELRVQPRFRELFARWRRVREPLRDGRGLLEEDPEAAVPLLQQAATKDSPVRRQARIALADAYMRLERVEEAFELCRLGLEEHQDPALFRAWLEAAKRLDLAPDGVDVLRLFPFDNQPSTCVDAAVERLEALNDPVHLSLLRARIDEVG
ncbi:MAG: tetratricopeptide repeat protein [Myxococcota bacterium]